MDLLQAQMYAAITTPEKEKLCVALSVFLTGQGRQRFWSLLPQIPVQSFRCNKNKELSSCYFQKLLDDSVYNSAILCTVGRRFEMIDFCSIMSNFLTLPNIMQEQLKLPNCVWQCISHLLVS